MSDPIGWDNLPSDVLAELTDPKFKNRQHHSVSTSRDGCRGPLCKKAEREKKARRDARQAIAAGRTIKSLPLNKRRPGDIFRDELLNEIFAWHMLERTRPKGVEFGDSTGPGSTQSEVGSLAEDDDSLRERGGLPDSTEDRADSVVRSVSA